MGMMVEMVVMVCQALLEHQVDMVKMERKEILVLRAHLAMA